MDDARTRCLPTLSETKIMKKFLLATVALAAFAAPALGADLGARPYYNNKAPAYVAPIYNWTGFYIGGHIGGAFAGSNNFNGLVLSDYSARFLGGLQAGADYQFAPNWVLGVEGQYSWLSGNFVNATFRAAPSTTTTSAASARSPAASATPGVRVWSMSKAATPIPTTVTR